jgi:hypothetical protein
MRTGRAKQSEKNKIYSTGCVLAPPGNRTASVWVARPFALLLRCRASAGDPHFCFLFFVLQQKPTMKKHDGETEAHGDRPRKRTKKKFFFLGGGEVN